MFFLDPPSPLFERLSLSTQPGKLAPMPATTRPRRRLVKPTAQMPRHDVPTKSHSFRAWPRPQPLTFSHRGLTSARPRTRYPRLRRCPPRARLPSLASTFTPVSRSLPPCVSCWPHNTHALSIVAGDIGGAGPGRLRRSEVQISPLRRKESFDADGTDRRAHAGATNYMKRCKLRMPTRHSIGRHCMRPRVSNPK